ncbi:hypothetical protein MAR_015264 [Mya arenaria]|uniref:Uncharacterized protein n=1 Tax=Mya arenaria TaxID=6604 RepID=A0ABY7FGI5_MYAAR|nr:hypothetical protein MAR_015264 [Mya arenaria]
MGVFAKKSKTLVNHQRFERSCILLNIIGLIKNKDGALKDDTLQIHKEEETVPAAKDVTSPVSPLSPSSIYTFGGSEAHRHLELKARGVSTRQCKFEIGEEWEQFQTIQTTKSVSCPPTPLMGAKKHKDLLDEETGRTNPGYAASEPGAEIEADLTDSADKLKEPFPFHFMFASTSGTPPKHYTVVPNPHNSVNQRFHSTLQCPCFLFFFFLCCLPGVHFMQQSDLQFKKGNDERARNYGKLATAFYIVGAIIGVAFLAIAIYFATDYVRQYV